MVYFLSLYNMMVEEERAVMVLQSVEQQENQRMQQLRISKQQELDQLLVLQQQQKQQQQDENLQLPDNKIIISNQNKEALILRTDFGKITIVLRPDLSEGSVDYIHRLIDNGTCRRCNLYRAEKPGILQGVMANRDIPTNNVLGSCPSGMETITNHCPEWDAHCACHGPLMTRGAVAWAAGQAGGPDFFIDNYKAPATWWGTQHTNWGFIEDAESFRVISTIFEQPATEDGGMTILNQAVHFEMELALV